MLQDGLFQRAQKQLSGLLCALLYFLTDKSPAAIIPFFIFYGLGRCGRYWIHIGAREDMKKAPKSGEESVKPPGGTRGFD